MNKRKQFIDSTGIDVGKLRQLAADEEARKNEEIIKEINHHISLINNAYDLILEEIKELLEKFREAEATRYDDGGNHVVYSTDSKSLIIDIKFSTGLREMLEKIESYNTYVIPEEDKLSSKILKIFETYTIEYFYGTGTFEFDLDPRLL